MKLLLKYSIISLIIICTACTPDIKDYGKSDKFNIDSSATKIPFATPEVIRLHESNLKREYKIGPGDRINIQVWNRSKLSGEHTVGPFGVITLPMLGEFKIGGMNRSYSANLISKDFGKYYNDPVVTVKILKYLNNKVYVLGRVSNPGVIHFSGGGTLLEALSMAGGLPTRDKTIFLSKCYIVRGNNQIIWINLLQLLQKANIKLNIRLANNDIIYIPASMDAAVFVMGDVKNPGSYQIQTSGLSVLDAINLAGGPTEDANVNEIRLVRDMKEKDGVRVINLENMTAKGDFSKNYRLKDNDIIFIPKRGAAKFNYFLRQIDPFLRTFITGLLINDAVK
ncbi:MAG: sugar transporter [Desulfobacterales bacterium]|nr:sugar transporter [Desulfobacterales bacterium]MCP4163561.1 sugar transporter [Deltaproteobacteria bacterium]